MSMLPTAPHRCRQGVLVWLLLLTLALGSGCATAFRPAPELVTPEQAATLPGRLQGRLDNLRIEGERNAVMNLADVATLALDMQRNIPPDLQPLLIDHALDEAMLRIDAVYADTASARQARSVWHSEGAKDFKGEPYERAFVYLLRGLRYYQAGDVGNARACFLSGSLQDTLSEEGEFNADMGEFDYLISLCDARMGSPVEAQEAFARAAKHYHATTPPKADDNVLVVLLAGRGPVKTPVGEYHEILLYSPGPLTTTGVDLLVDNGAPAILPRADDYFYQATTRGGRAVDTINKNKAVIKGTTDTVGSAALIGGTIAALNGGRRTQEVGLAIVAVGILAKIAASSMHATADARTIDGIPYTIYLWSGHLAPGTHRVQLSCTGGSKPYLIDRQVTIVKDAPPTVLLLRAP